MLKLFLTLVFGISTYICLSAQNGLDAPMTKAVMKVYQQLIDEDPTDFDTYYRRACEYYKHNQYNLALSDINNALKYVSTSTKETQIEYIMLRANIYQQMDSLDNALNDYNKAYTLDPYSYLTLYQKANLEYQLGLYDEAKNDYLRMQRINNRSQEALIGLARIAVKESNFGLANEYIDQAVAISPSDSEIYIRRASVKSLMGNDNGAVDDLILAISTDNTNTKALHELVKLSNSNYNAVMIGLSNAIRQAPNVGMFYYIRAVIAQSHYKYVNAISDYKKILNDNLYNYYGIYASIAECYYALGNYTEALDNIDFAISGSAKVKSYYKTKAQILNAINQSEDAITYTDKALILDSNYNDALIEKALALNTLNKHNDATALLGEAFFNDASNAFTLIMRGWILEHEMGLKNNAITFYKRAIDSENEKQIKSLTGFAHLTLGEIDQAKMWIETILNNISQSDGVEYYYATCIYAWIGEYDKAFIHMEEALKKGYAHYHNWINNNYANINVAPIRNLPQFNELLIKYELNFK